MSSVSERMYKHALQASDGLPVLKVETYRAIDKNNFALIFSSISTNKEFSQSDYSQALESISDNKLSIVADSLFRMPTDNTPIMRCIAAANSESLPAKQETIASMKKISANVLEDDRGVMWKMEGEGDTRRIVQVNQEDFGELLAKRRRYGQMTASLDDNIVVDYRDTDYVYFMNPEIEAMDFGFVVQANGNRDFVVSRALKAAVQIKPHQVVEAASTTGTKLGIQQRKSEIVASSTDAAKDWIAYLVELYGRGSEYVRAWEAAIRGSANRIS